MKLDLIGSLKMLLVLLGVFGAYKFIAIIFLLFLGATARTALSGTIRIPAAMNTTLNTTVTSISTGFAAFNTGDAFILGLIALVTLLKVFWPVIAQYMPDGNKKKGSSGGNGGFMG